LFAGGTEEGSIPTTEIEKSIFDDGIGIIDLLRKTGLIKTNSEGRRLIEQGGITIDDIKVETTDKKITLDDFNEGKILIRKGKKIYHQVKCK
jgi:tyrosyl-tRNA synthetase